MLGFAEVLHNHFHMPLVLQQYRTESDQFIVVFLNSRSGTTNSNSNQQASKSTASNASSKGTKTPTNVKTENNTSANGSNDVSISKKTESR